LKENTNKETVKGELMEKKRSVNHSWYSNHPDEVLEIVGNIATVATFIGITYLILRYLIKYGYVTI
jgi:hypothetical protein